jgi:hypothetical protein
MAEMTAQEAAEWGKTLDFPTVWAALMETGKRVDRLTERDQATRDFIDRLGEKVDRAAATVDGMGERIDRLTEHDQARNDFIDKLGEKVDRTTETINKMGEKVDRVTANVGGLNQSMGDLIETLFAPHLGEKFDVYNYNLKRVYNRVPIYDDDSRLRSDIDILLSNTTVCMAVEVKRWMEKTSHVDEHIKRMHLIRQYPPAEVKGKKLLGAIVGAVVKPEVREYAEQNGFFVLELTGEDVHLLEPPENFQPKEW